MLCPWMMETDQAKMEFGHVQERDGGPCYTAQMTSAVFKTLHEGDDNLPRMRCVNLVRETNNYRNIHEPSFLL